jgi:AcrR family transcriptional regulator
VRTAQRERLIRAMISATAEHGYFKVTVADVVARAKVSRAAFYAHFSDKDDCLLAATLHGRRLMTARIQDETRALPPETPPDAALRHACRAYLGFLTEEPEFARVMYLDLPSAGPGATERLLDAQDHFARLNRRWHRRARDWDPALPELPDDAFLAAVGATTELVRQAVFDGRRPADLEDTLVAVHLALLTGRPWSAT